MLDDGQLSEVEEASETSTIGEERHEDNEDNEDNDDNEDSITINGEHANDSESVSRATCRCTYANALADIQKRRREGGYHVLRLLILKFTSTQVIFQIDV